MDFDHFSVALLVLRDDAPDLTEAEEAALQDAHMDHLARLHEAGALLAARPLMVGVDEATALKAADPAVIAGRYSVTVLPWMVPAGAAHFRPARFPHSAAE